MGAVGDFVGSITGSAGAEAAGQAAGVNLEELSKGRRALKRGFRGTRKQFKPFIRGGRKAFGQQAALSGALGGREQAAAFEQFQQSPGQQFLQQRAEESLLRNAAATGQLGGGRTPQALQEQAIGFAQQDFDAQFGRLGQVAQQGAAFTSQLGGLRGQRAQGIAGLREAGGTAAAQGITGAQDARDTGAQNILGLAGAAAGFFSDIRLKDNVKKVGVKNGHNLYTWTWNEKAKEFNLKGDDFGFIAQEVQKTNPEFVIEGEFLKLDKDSLYKSIGVH